MIGADGDIERFWRVLIKTRAIFMAHQDFYIPLFESGNLGWIPRCAVIWRFIPSPPRPRFGTDYEIRQLTIDYLDVMLNTYSYIGNKDYIAKAHLGQIMYGAFLGDELLGAI